MYRRRSDSSVHCVVLLTKKSVAPGLVGPRDRRLVVEACKHQDRHVLAARQAPQALAGDETIDFGHQRIENDDVRLVVAVELQRACASVRLDHSPLAFRECRGRQQTCHRIVIDQQYEVAPLPLAPTLERFVGSLAWYLRFLAHQQHLILNSA